ncbi:MAG: hypothetical protein GY792_16100 [Gammaproteobacteria bacterium]|nr:hypothetical protein [Gammaproteobacteria bacterium]
MIEKSESNQLSLATAPILGQAPSEMPVTTSPDGRETDLKPRNWAGRAAFKLMIGDLPAST